MRTLTIALFLLFSGYSQAQTTVSPVLQVDYPYPTTDKPQSKLWFAGNRWWALLPRSTGPSLWQRTAAGWKEQLLVNKDLQGVPGRADVWSDKDGVMAVGVGTDSLVIFQLVAPAAKEQWHGRVLATLRLPAKQNIETATIARDANGHWWVAADGNTSIYAWYSADGHTWSPAMLLKENISKDDICLVTTVRGGVMVTWSNQQEEAVQCRLHRNGHAVTDWEQQVVIEAGNKTADDHLHAVYRSNGTVWMVTKNSVDHFQSPQLVLRVRNTSGNWHNLPYAPRTEGQEPSRPVIIAVQNSEMLLAGNTVYNKTDRYQDGIEFGYIDTCAADILIGKRMVIQPAAAMHAKVNDCTVSKDSFPANAPWIVLASDAEGRVYEADLRLYFPATGKARKQAR